MEEVFGRALDPEGVEEEVIPIHSAGIFRGFQDGGGLECMDQ